MNLIRSKSGYSVVYSRESNEKIDKKKYSREVLTHTHTHTQAFWRNRVNSTFNFEIVNVKSIVKWLTRDFKALTISRALENLGNLESENSIEQKGGVLTTSDGAQRWTVYGHCAFAHGAIKARIEWRPEWAQFHRAWNTDFIIRLLILRHGLLACLYTSLAAVC